MYALRLVTKKIAHNAKAVASRHAITIQRNKYIIYNAIWIDFNTNK